MLGVALSVFKNFIFTKGVWKKCMVNCMPFVIYLDDCVIILLLWPLIGKLYLYITH